MAKYKVKAEKSVVISVEIEAANKEAAIDDFWDRYGDGEFADELNNAEMDDWWEVTATRVRRRDE